MNTAPLSDAAREATVFYFFIAKAVRWIGGIFIFILTIGLVLDYRKSPADLANLLMGGIMVLLVLVYVSLVIYTTVRFRKKKEEVQQANEMDFALAQAIANSIGNLPQDLESVFRQELDAPGIITLNGLIPLRVEYEPQENLEGSLKFYFPGLRTAIFGGMVSGSIKGEISPDLSQQNVFILCERENGDTVRLLCPVPKRGFALLRRAIVKILEDSFGLDMFQIRFMPKTHTIALAREFLYVDHGVGKLFDLFDPNPVIDYVAAKMDSPKEQRPKITASGIQSRGGLSVSLMGCDGKDTIVLCPLSLINRIIASFERQLLETAVSPQLIE